jgi:hypothetical protein
VGKEKRYRTSFRLEVKDRGKGKLHLRDRLNRELVGETRRTVIAIQMTIVTRRIPRWQRSKPLWFAKLRSKDPLPALLLPLHQYLHPLYRLLLLLLLLRKLRLHLCSLQLLQRNSQNGGLRNRRLQLLQLFLQLQASIRPLSLLFLHFRPRRTPFLFFQPLRTFYLNPRQLLSK